ncbi:MAG: site-specific integrase [Oscillospiraceae bacterium]|nr:site-specific integrase [Oscillospiraceae bacterium]
MQELLLKYSNDDYISNDMLFTDYLDMWLKQSKPLIKPSTWEGYNKVVSGKIKPYFADKGYKLSDLKGRHFTGYFVYLKEHGRSDNKGGLCQKAVLNIRGVLSSAFRYALENDLIKYNFIERSRMPMYEPKKFEPTIYTAEQIKTLLTYAEETKSKMCLFLFLEMFTGARKGELLALTWDNVNFDDGTIHICQNRTGSKKEVLDIITSPKTKNGIRTVPLPEKVMDMLKAEKALQEHNKSLLKDCYKSYDYDYVIRQEDGSIYNPNSINRIIKKMTDKIGLPHCRIHDYRHAVASMLFESGTPLADVTTQLGHGQTSTTERIYIHRHNVAKSENIKALSDTIGI